MKKMLFVYNPRSGKGQIRNQLSTIMEMFSAADYDITIYPTKRAMDGCEAVQSRAEEFDVIVCSGGDGTLDEVVTGLMNSGIRRPIGYIPAGSTNDFAISVGIPKSMDMAAKAVVDGAPFSCDLGKMNENYFVYVAAFGMFTDVSYQTPQDLKNMLGHAAYLLEGMKRVGTWKTWNLQIKSEEFSGEGEFVFGMITNSSSVGGIKGITGKHVEMNDGLFEVMLVRNPKNIMHLQEIITAVVTGENSANSLVRFKTRKLEILSETPVAWTRDGENGGEHTHVVLENLHQAFEILVKDTSETQPYSELTEQAAAETAVTVETLTEEISDADEEAAEGVEAEGMQEAVKEAETAEAGIMQESAKEAETAEAGIMQESAEKAEDRRGNEGSAAPRRSIGDKAKAQNAAVVGKKQDIRDAEYRKAWIGTALAHGIGMSASVEQAVMTLERVIGEIAAEFSAKL